jgi:hypothetical protein
MWEHVVYYVRAPWRLRESSHSRIRALSVWCHTTFMNNTTNNSGTTLLIPFIPRRRTGSLCSLQVDAGTNNPRIQISHRSPWLATHPTASTHIPNISATIFIQSSNSLTSGSLLAYLADSNCCTKTLRSGPTVRGRFG